ncbi:hypothetical protein NDU88_001324 [Pleurodeles waltl]|uniref:Uncharacterized protein n=1 Tax=Pleurodeles waltl TaxID=8319 RepID=A0AAV7SZK6_PLEWA|nr:hypothetical protein NDU88_001324 [Pleurodeles waltl]
MWPILHSRPIGTCSSSRISLTTGEKVRLQVVYTNTDASLSLGRVEDDLALVPITSTNLETFDYVNSTTSQTDGAVYSVPPQETPTPPLTTATPFARTASGYFAHFNDDFSDSFASSTADLSSAHVYPITTRLSANFSGAEPTRIKTQRKQYKEGKTLTSPHLTRNQDAMEPELQILPVIVFLLLYQERQRRRR